MGRKTFDSLGKPLPNRRHIVITHNQDWRAEGVEVVHSLVDAIALASVDEQAFIIGGATIYQQAIESGIADHVYETLVHAEVDGDTFLPFDTKHDWELESVEACQADEKNEFAYTFRIWKRKE